MDERSGSASRETRQVGGFRGYPGTVAEAVSQSETGNSVVESFNLIKLKDTFVVACCDPPRRLKDEGSFVLKQSILSAFSKVLWSPLTPGA